jgi:hypothetical protein
MGNSSAQFFGLPEAFHNVDDSVKAVLKIVRHTLPLGRKNYISADHFLTDRQCNSRGIVWKVL